MINDMNAFELSDEQLAEVAGGALVEINTIVSPQVNINNQINNVISPTIGTVVSAGGIAELQQMGSQTRAGNGSLLGNGFKLK